MLRLAPLLLLAACAAAPLVLTAADAGRPALVKTGEPFTVQLSGQAGTGYQWNMTPPAGVTLVDQSSASTAPPGVNGGGMMETFHLRGDAPGAYVLHFSYDRPWAGGEKGANVADFPVTVR